MTSGQRRRVRVGFEIVAMGCSAGGLRALQTILGELPQGFPAAVLIAQHRLAEVDSKLAELLQRRCQLVVLEPNDKEPIVSGQVYLAPGGYHMLAEVGFISLSVEPPVSFARPSIDVLFESVADAYGAQAIAVVLTGANDDGAIGARAIQDAGGCVLVEDPTTAESPTLPRAAIKSCKPDAVVPLSAIAGALVRRCKGQVPGSAEPRST
jgi:two-component system, chemotaxis family, protein-glutamate methylesterase/glutaminase